MSYRPNTTGAIGEGLGPSQFPRRSRTRPISRIPERRLWSYSRPKFYIHDSSGSSQGGSSTQSGGGNSTTTSEGRRGMHTVSPYGSFFVEDMDIDGPAGSHGRAGGTAAAADLNNNNNNNDRAIYQTSSARMRPPSSQSQNDALYRQQPSPTRLVPCLFESTEATYVGMPQPGALPTPTSSHRHNLKAPQEGEEEGTTLTAAAATQSHRSQSSQNRPTSWSREYHRNRTNSPHNNNSQARPPREVLTGTARLPPSGSQAGRSFPSNPDGQRQRSRGVTRTAWRK